MDDSTLSNRTDVVPIRIRWREEMPGAVYLVDTGPGKRFRAFWFTGPLAEFWRRLAEGGARYAHRRTLDMVGNAWSLRHSLGALGELAAAGLVDPAVAPASLLGLARPLAEQPEIESVSARIRMSRLPWYLLWEVTWKCNLACVTCYATEIDSAKKRSVPHEHMERFIDELVAADLFHVTLIGGEPFAWSLLEEACARLKGAGVYVKIVSNGTLITRDRAMRIAAAGVNQVDVSVDGLTREENDLVRGAGSFDAIRRGVRNLQEAGLPAVVLSMTVGKHNLSRLDDLPERANAIFGIEEIFLTRLICSGNGRNVNTWQMGPEEIGRLKHLLDHAWPSRRPDVMVCTQRWHCDCARTRMVVSVDGSVRPCTFHGARIPASPGGLVASWRDTMGFDQIRRPYAYMQTCSECTERLTCAGTMCSARVHAKEAAMISDVCIREERLLSLYGA